MPLILPCNSEGKPEGEGPFKLHLTATERQLLGYCPSQDSITVVTAYADYYLPVSLEVVEQQMAAANSALTLAMSNLSSPYRKEPSRHVERQERSCMRMF